MRGIMPCPDCGYSGPWTVKSTCSKRRYWRIVCRHCMYSPGSARTLWGAIRRWNKAADMISKKRKEVQKDGE